MIQLDLFTAPDERWERDPHYPQFDRLALGSGPLSAAEVAALGLGGWQFVAADDWSATLALDGSSERATFDMWRENIDVLLLGARRGVVWEGV